MRSNNYIKILGKGISWHCIYWENKNVCPASTTFGVATGLRVKEGMSGCVCGSVCRDEYDMAHELRLGPEHEAWHPIIVRLIITAH